MVSERTITLEAENMAEKTPGQPLIRNRSHDYWGIFKNNYLAHTFGLTHMGDDAGTYLVEVKARCRLKKKVPPKMRVVLDGKNLGESVVKEPGWHLYRFKTHIKGDTHRIEVHLTNNPDDAYNHRYLHVDWVRIRRFPR